MEKTKHLTTKRKVIPLPMDATFFFERAVQSLDRYRYDKALKYFRRAVEYEPDNAVNHCNMAGILSEMGNYAESNSVLQHIVDRVDPSMTECYFFMANNFANMENFEAAEDALIQYLESDPEGHFVDESEEMMEMLSFELERPMKQAKIKSRGGIYEHDHARVLLEEGKFTDAILLLESIVKTHPEFSAAHNNLALAYFYVGRYSDSLTAVKRVLEIDPGNLHGLCNLAIFYHHSGEREALVALVEQLEKTVPFHQEHAFKLATTMGVLGFHESALRHFRRLLKTETGGADACLSHYAAVACYNLGLIEEARKHWKKAEKIDPSSDIPKFYLQVLDHVEREGASCAETLTISYHYHLPFEELQRQLHRAMQSGEVPQPLRHDPLLRSSFFWALRFGEREAKLQFIQAYGSIGDDEEVAAALKELLLDASEDDYVKKVSVFVLRSIGMDKPLPAIIGGRRIEVEHNVYTPNLPEWDVAWQQIIDLAVVHMSPRYDMIQQFDMVTLWVEFLSRVYPELPKMTKKEGWAAALEYLTAKMHRRTVTYQEVAVRYGVSITTVSKYAKLIDEACGLRKKMNAIFANFQEKL